MQCRMKLYQLTTEQIEDLFSRAEVGRFVTQNPDGFPYAIPMHFVYHNERVYMHGLPKWQKIDNINKNPKVCFEVDEVLGYRTAGIENPCDTNTAYNSIVALGYAKLIDNVEYKREILNKVVNKYTPQFSGYEMPENMVKGTAVIEIEITECTGKYYK